jgi:hypothetical protein
LLGGALKPLGRRPLHGSQARRARTHTPSQIELSGRVPLFSTTWYHFTASASFSATPLPFANATATKQTARVASSS